MLPRLAQFIAGIEKPAASLSLKANADAPRSLAVECELRPFLDAGGPARRHRLGLGVKPDRVGAILVEVAEAGAFPAAEGVIRHRHGDRHVDADHADLDARGELTRGIAVTGED